MFQSLLSLYQNRTYLGPGIPKLQKYWLEKSMPNVEEDWDNYAGDTDHSDQSTLDISVSIVIQ